MKFKILTSLILLYLSFSQLIIAQVVAESPKGSIPGKLSIHGWVKEMSVSLKDTDVILYQYSAKTGNYIEVKRVKTPIKGEYNFQLDLYSKYMIELSKEDYTTKKIVFDTDVMQLTNTPAPFEFIVDMVRDREGLGYLKPMATVLYQRKSMSFDYQLDYSKEEQEKDAKSKQERIEKLELQRKAAEEKAKQN